MTKIRINLRCLSDDILAGMRPREVMKKYALSDKGLIMVCERLVGAGLLTQSQAENWFRDSEGSHADAERITDVSREIGPEAPKKDYCATSDDTEGYSLDPSPLPGTRECENHGGVQGDPQVRSSVNASSDAPDTKKRKLETEARSPNPFFSFFGKAVLWGACTLVLGKVFAVYQLWIVVLSVFLVSVTIVLSTIYMSTIDQIRRLHMFASQGWLFRLMSRRFMRVVFWIIWALGTSFFMLVQFHTYSPLDWGTFFLVIPVFYCVFAACRRFLARELRGYLVVSFSLRWSTRLTPLIMLVLYVVFVTQLGAVPRYGSLQEAINAQKALVGDMTGSALVAEASQWVALYNGAKAFALGNLAAYDTLSALIIMAFGSLVVFFNACTMLACLLIPSQEYRRVFSRLSSEPVLPPVRPSRVAIISAVMTFVAIFVYVPAFTVLEAWMQQRSPQWAEARKKAERLAVRVVEQVGNEYVNEGSIAKIEAAKVEALRKVQVSLVRVEAEADRAFDRLSGNVDGFLNWYYSLPAEYARIANLLIGNLEDYLRDKLAEYLQQGDAFRGVETALDQALANHKSALEEYNQTVQKIISENRINVSGTKFHVAQSMSLSGALNPPIHQDKLDLRTRLGGGAIAGTVTAVISGKIISKVIGKATIKKAAQVLAAVVAKKAVGTAAGAAPGAAAGAIIGSVIPGFGTAAGAFVGGILGGVVAGVTVDKLILMLEEALSRDAFKRELLESIEAARSDFKRTLKAP